MRPRQILRTSRLAKLGATALMLAIPASAVALTANQADAQSATQIKLDRHQLAYGRSVTVTGSTAPTAAGQPLALQFAVPHGAWQRLATTRVGTAGHFRFVTALKHTGFVRVTPANGTVAPRSGSVPSLSGGATVAPSASQRVAVAARFRLRSRQFSVLGGQPVHVRGKLLPAFGGRRVRLPGPHRPQLAHAGEHPYRALRRFRPPLRAERHGAAVAARAVRGRSDATRRRHGTPVA